MIDYEHDIFISYSHATDDWVKWTSTVFYPALENELVHGLSSIKIFIDNKKIDTGYSWPDDLIRAHSRSRLLIPLLSVNYFTRPWCLKELAFMYERELKHGFRTAAKPGGLILPVIIRDHRLKLPQAIVRINSVNFTHAADPSRNTKKGKLNNEVRKFAKTVLDALYENIPPYDHEWEKSAYTYTSKYEELFKIIPEQKQAPKLNPSQPED